MCCTSTLLLGEIGEKKEGKEPMKTPQISHSTREIPHTQAHADLRRLDMIICQTDEDHVFWAVLYQLLCFCSAWRLGSGLLFVWVIFSTEVLKWGKTVSDVLPVAIQCHQPLKHQITNNNVILILKEKHDTLLPMRKKMNSILAKTRTLAVYNCLKSFFLVSLSEYTWLQFDMCLKVALEMSG